MDPTASSAALAAASAASAAPAASTLGTPAGAALWTLDALRGADPLLGLALIVIVAVIAGDAVQRWTRLPRTCGHMLVGAIASPLALRLIDRTDLDPWKPLLDLAVGVLVFELGSRVRLRWLIDNRWLTAQSLAEALLAGLAVTAVLSWFGAPAASAALAGAIAMSTSPVITMAVLHERQTRGQVTERLLTMTALNSVLAVLAVKVWRVFASGAVGGSDSGSDWLIALTNMVYVICGSFLLGAALAMLLKTLSRPNRDSGSTAVLQLGLLVVAALLAVQWTLSPLLALLIGGTIARARLGHRLIVTPQLGTAGAALTVLLFVSMGLLATVDGFRQVWHWVLVIIVARALGKGLAVAAFTRVSGLGWRQSAALVLALMPMSQTALLLSHSTYGWPTDSPGIDGGIWQALLIATTLLQLVGPILTQVGLVRVAGESPQQA